MDCKDHPQNWKFIILFAHVYPIIFQQGTCRNRILDYRLSYIYKIYIYTQTFYSHVDYTGQDVLCTYMYIYPKNWLCTLCTIYII
jgi:hypothetical protein